MKKSTASALSLADMMEESAKSIRHDVARDAINWQNLLQLLMQMLPIILAFFEPKPKE